MNLGIVGTSKQLSESEENDMRQSIVATLNRYDKKDTLVISGGAIGVDSLAIEIAQKQGFATKEYRPHQPENWESYKTRNIEIAKASDEIYCFTIPVRNSKCYHHKPIEDHEKTAGCWTLNRAKELNKTTVLVVVGQ